MYNYTEQMDQTTTRAFDLNTFMDSLEQRAVQSATRGEEELAS